MSAGESWTPPEWAVTDRGDSLHNGLEVRADLLRSQDEGFVLSQLALVRRRSEGTALSGSISTALTGLSWICVGIHSRRALRSPVCAKMGRIWC